MHAADVAARVSQRASREARLGRQGWVTRNLARRGALRRFRSRASASEVPCGSGPDSPDAGVALSRCATEWRQVWHSDGTRAETLEAVAVARRRLRDDPAYTIPSIDANQLVEAEELAKQ